MITYGIDYNGAYVSPFTEMTGMAQPKYVWTPSIAPSGLTIYEEDLFPSWKDSLFVGALVNRDVRRLSLENGKISKEEILFSVIEPTRRTRPARPAASRGLVMHGVADAQRKKKRKHIGKHENIQIKPLKTWNIRAKS